MNRRTFLGSGPALALPSLTDSPAAVTPAVPAVMALGWADIKITITYWPDPSAVPPGLADRRVPPWDPEATGVFTWECVTGQPLRN